MASWLIQSLSICCLCVFLAGILIPQILLIAFRRSLFDEPDPRKIHKGTIPRLGGIAFTPVICFSLSLWYGLSLISDNLIDWDLNVNAIQVSFGFCALLLLYIIGMADDLIGIRYRAKFIIQLICAVLLLCGGLCCQNFEGILGFHQVSYTFGAIITVIMIVFVANAINLIDGLDGLASGLSMAGFLIYGISFGMIGNTSYALVSFAALGVIIPFFGFNVFGNPKKHRKIFMGDTGALTIGLLLSFLGLALLKDLTARPEPFTEINPMLLVVAPLIIPLMDVVRVFIRRLRHHGNPFLPDRTHIHHKLLDAGLRPRVAMVTIVATAIAFSVTNIVLSIWLDIDIILAMDIFAWILVNHTLNKKKKTETAI